MRPGNKNNSKENGETKKKKNFKKKKVHLIFDEKERTEFLTGLRKRNLERKVKRKEVLDKMLKEEKKKIKSNQKEALKNAILSQRQVPEVQHLLEPVTYDLPDHTVTISEIKDMDPIYASSSINMEAKSKVEVDKLQKLIKDLKSDRIKTIKKSSVQLKAKKEQKKQDKQKAKKKRQLFKKGLKNTKKKHQKKHTKKAKHK